MSGDKSRWSPEARAAAALRAEERMLTHREVQAVRAKRREVESVADQMSEVMAAFEIAKTRHPGHRLLYDLVATGPSHVFHCLPCGAIVHVSHMEACAGVKP